MRSSRLLTASFISTVPFTIVIKAVILSGRICNGRTQVVVDYERITQDNVVKALQTALPSFERNIAEINYLWEYYKGKQEILNREKNIRPEINNKVVVNIAQEIVAFKIGYQLAEPLQYTARMQSSSDNAELYEQKLEQVTQLNTLMFAEDKAAHDRDLFEWLCIAGIGFRMIQADTDDVATNYEQLDDSPFEIYTLDPRKACVVRSSLYHNKPLMAIYKTKDVENDKPIYNVYTEDVLYTIKDDNVINSRAHTYGSIPIIEYRLNNARMGVFEPVLDALDAINNIESNRLDDVEQTIQSLIKFVNCNIDDKKIEQMRKLGAVKVKSIDPALKADIDVIKTDLDQSGVQALKDDLYKSVIKICGMPNSGDAASSSDTGAAVLLRDGWTLAEAHAKSYELQFKTAEREFLRVVLNICKQSIKTDFSLNSKDIEFSFNRRNYENILVKSQVLTTMLSSDKIHPQLAFQSCGLFTDPDAAYKQSCEYVEDNKEDEQDDTQADTDNLILPASQPATPEPDKGVTTVINSVRDIKSTHALNEKE